MSVNIKALELAEAIKNTREFRELKQAHIEINKHPELAKKVELFNKKQQEVLAAAQINREMEAIIAELNQTYRILSAIPQVNNYLKASKNFQNMTAKVFKTINDSLESALRGR